MKNNILIAILSMTIITLLIANRVQYNQYQTISNEYQTLSSQYQELSSENQALKDTNQTLIDDKKENEILINSLKQQVLLSEQTENGKLIHTLEYFVVYNRYFINFVYHYYFDETTGQYRLPDVREMNNELDCDFTGEMNYEDWDGVHDRAHNGIYPLKDFFETPEGEKLILKRKIYDTKIELDEFTSFNDSLTNQETINNYKSQIKKYEARLKELGF